MEEKNPHKTHEKKVPLIKLLRYFWNYYKLAAMMSQWNTGNSDTDFRMVREKKPNHYIIN